MEAKIGYQIFPDRFYSYYHRGNTDWNTPITNDFNSGKRLYGGDLKGIEEKVSYLKELNIDFLYLTPIFESNSNHRYDAKTYFKIDPVLGDEIDLKNLIDTLHNNNIELCLDIALNHMSNESDWFKNALKNKKEKDFFRQENGNFTYWRDHKSLVELNLENKELQNLLWQDENSAMKKWTKLGVDHWRLDCAYDLGFDILKDIVIHLKSLGNHEIIGEVWAYPKDWIQIMDGIMNYYYTVIIKNMLNGTLKPITASQILKKVIFDSGMKLLKSWNMLSSHDSPRIKNVFGKKWKLAVVMQFTLPGSPLIYYGEEIGMEGDHDPFCRGVMEWEKVDKDNETLNFYKKLINLFKNSEALKKGKYYEVIANDDNILAYYRKYKSIKDGNLIVINPSNEDKEIQLYFEESLLLDAMHLSDHFSDNELYIEMGSIKGKIPANSFGIFYMKPKEYETYSAYKRL
ncbi:Glycosidase [Marinitoga hydrogenitolerans DSM 16785]|uniref:Glycosidase n=1 Tax=Marinitoga hydrogenitolerans (strain DSM 16785 / JCM 12826 / AT1271) TaxID=1122195 RepID=A0A1M4T077_MARH1|nr:alpha-amylase family glycosyl hydrolase [Marinitoga hydrogenitolerans]SHE37780.1 Glycosidase [Marinitoga hydrogenitolerans DSM 16785]